MSVITVDTRLERVPRNVVLDWLSEPAHHRELLERGFGGVRGAGDAFEVDLPGRVVMVYRFRSVDQSHGGRRVLVDLDGKRTKGELHFSLRTTKPEADTLVTAHADYRSGRLLGPVLDAAWLREAIERGLAGMLGELKKRLAVVEST